MPEILISLSSFGAAEVGRHGQLWCTEIARQAGADGCEIRGEMLNDAAAELPALLGRAAVFSSADGLFRPDGLLDVQALTSGLQSAQIVQATRLKMAIGGFSEHSLSSLEALRQQLATQSVELVIENDQSPAAGTIDALQRFFEALDCCGLDLGMTFDMGNWHWLGECPLEAARLFASRVRYVHCKGVQRLPAKWVAVPLADSCAPWRSVMRALPHDVPRAIEFPLIGDDLVRTTQLHVELIRHL